MIGHWVRVYGSHGAEFDGVLVHQDSNGVVVHNNRGLNDERRFIPYTAITSIKDMGRAP
jgi:hypothetical protein